jgi:hypothetical protein
MGLHYFRAVAPKHYFLMLYGHAGAYALRSLTPFPKLVPSFVIGARSTSASSFLVADSLLSFAVRFLLAGTDGEGELLSRFLYGMYLSV